MKETVVRTRTIDMSILDEGTGPLVLLCHGFPETKYAWRHQLTALADAGYRAVAPDMRGYGNTGAPEREDQYTTFHVVGDMIALMDALGERKAIVVGHDWGATIAWQAALLRPDRFRAVVALSVPMMGQPPVPPTKIFPHNDEELFYTLYFQTPGLAEAEFNRDVAMTLRKLLFAASGEAGPRKPGNNTPTPFGMVSRKMGLLANPRSRNASRLASGTGLREAGRRIQGVRIYRRPQLLQESGSQLGTAAGQCRSAHRHSRALHDRRTRYGPCHSRHGSDHRGHADPRPEIAWISCHPGRRTLAPAGTANRNIRADHRFREATCRLSAIGQDIVWGRSFRGPSAPPTSRSRQLIAQLSAPVRECRERP